MLMASWLEDYNFVFWIVGLVTAFYLGTPLIILFSQKLSAKPLLTPLHMHSLDSQLSAFLMEKTTGLYELGFDEPTLLSMPNATPGVKGYLVTLVNRPARDKAMVTCLVGDGAGAKLQTWYVEFSTRYDDDSVVDTLNSSELSAFPPGGKTIRTQVPSVTEVAQLYHLHQFVMNRHFPQKRKTLFEPDEVVKYLHENAFKKAYEEQVQRGWLKLEAGGANYWPTVKGAYLMTWGLLPPMKWFRMAKLKKQEQAILTEFRNSSR